MNIVCGFVVVINLLLMHKVLSENNDDGSGSDGGAGTVELKCEERTNREALCNLPCTSNGDCVTDDEKCICDGDCGLSCVNPDTRCPSAPSVSHAQKTVTHRKVHGVVTYTCDKGRTLFGSENRTCRGIGQWDGTSPKCLVFCGKPRRRSNSRYDVLKNGKRKYTQGSEVRYWCFDGYEMKGDSVLKCGRNGKWSSNPPSCKGIQCEFPELPDNAVLESRKKDKYSLGERVYMKCQSGYSFRGSPMRLCLGGMWSANSYYCKAKSCGDPGVPFNGERIGLVFTFKARIVFKCNTGYRLKGSRYRICQANQKWTGSLPTCQVIDCGYPPVPANGKVVGSIVSTSFGGKASFACNPGFTLHGAQERTCGEDSYWTGSKTECREVTCPKLNVLHGSVEPSGDIRVGVEITFSCNKDHVLIGRNKARCILGSNDKGFWNDDVPSCKRPCKVPDLPSESYTQGDYKHHKTMWFYCNADYVFVGTDRLQCTDGSWDRLPNIQCMKPCAIPDLPYKARRYGGNKHNENMNFYCEGDFVFEGTERLHCNDGNWNEIPQLSCKKPCPVPDTPSTMIKTGSNKHGKTMTFKCLENYVFEGTEQLMCTDGVWNVDPKLKCIALCPIPRTPSHGQVIGNDYKDGSTITYVCDNDYQISGKAKSTCVDGVWSPSEPQCLARCSPPMLAPNVQILNNKANFVEGETIVFKCMSDELTLEGKEKSTCLDKEWSNPSPRCLRGCLAPLKPKDGTLIGSEFYHGAKVTFKCDETFILDGSPVITCKDGVWSDKPPICKGCSMPLGMESGTIKDSQIKGEGSYYGTKHSDARLNKNSEWCAELSSSYRIYIEVDLGTNYEVNAISIQPSLRRAARMRQFILRHKKDKSDVWKDYQEGGQVKQLSADDRTLKEPFLARHLRLHPYSTRTEVGCMRMEIYGCPVSSGGCVRVGSDVLVKNVKEKPEPYLPGSVTSLDENRIIVKTGTGSTFIEVQKTEHFALALYKDIDKSTVTADMLVLARYKNKNKFYKASVLAITKTWVSVRYEAFDDKDWIRWEHLRPYKEAYLCDCPPCKVNTGLKRACDPGRSPYDFGIKLGPITKISTDSGRTIEGQVSKIIYSKDSSTFTLNNSYTFIHEMKITKSCGCPQIKKGITYLVFGKIQNGERIINSSSLVEEWSDAKHGRKVKNRCQGVN